MSIRWLSEEDVLKIIGIEDAISSIESAFVAYARGHTQMPSKIYLEFSQVDGDLRAMPAYIEDLSMAGVKVVSSHPRNPQMGLPTVQALLILNDPQTGAPLAVISASYLTDVRTGAAGAVAAKYLARKDSRIIGLVGCGRQARTQLQALTSIFKINKVKVIGLTHQEAEQFCNELAKDYSEVALFPSQNIQEVCQADIVVTTTPSQTPIIKSDWVLPGTHINAIGADAPGKQEIDPEILKRAKIVVDDMEQACHSGEVNVPLREGILRRDDIYACFGDIAAEIKPARSSPEEITIFDSTGLAIHDIAVGNLVYQRAQERNLGQILG